MADRETLDVDVLIVGGGPAGMSAALRLAQLQKEKGGEPLAIAVLEKAREARRALALRRDSRPVRPAPARAGFQGEGRAARVRGPPRPRVLPDARREDPISDYAAAAQESRPLHHLAQPVRQVARRTRRGRRRRYFHRVSRDRAPLRRRSRRRRAYRRSWDRPAWRAQTDFRARRRHSREGHDSDRRRQGQPHQDPRRAAETGCGQASAALCDRHQGALGVTPGAAGARYRHPHARVSAADGGVRRRLHLCDARRLDVDRPGGRTRLPRSDVRSARRVPAPQAASVRSVAADRRHDGSLRGEGAAGGRLAHHPRVSMPTAC